jgi:multicomponent Na+:H+ antiporter subunit A
VLALLGLLLGIGSPVIGTYLIGPAAGAALGTTATAKLTLWHGITPALGVSAVSILGGYLLYREWDILHRLKPRLATWTRLGPTATYEKAMTALKTRSNTLTAWMTERSALHTPRSCSPVSWPWPL